MYSYRKPKNRNALGKPDKRTSIGAYTVYCVIFTYIYLLLIHAMRYVDLIFQETTYTEMIVLIIFSTLLFILMLRLPYRLTVFGFNFHRWKLGIIEAVIYSLLSCAFAMGIKWILILWFPIFHDLPLVSLEVVNFTGGVTSNYGEIMYTVIVYVIIMVPFQSFVVHSAAQSPVLHLLRVKYRKLLSIVLATLWFSVMHISLPFGFAATMLIPGLFVASLYAHQRSLLGVWIAHSIIGVWGLYFLNIGELFGRIN